MRIEGLSADTFWKGEVRVSGLVTDGKEQHKARIYVKGSQVYDYSCSCVAGNSYRGMCPHCEARVKKALEAVEGVAEAKVSHESGTAVVTLNVPVEDAVLKKAVEDQDYKVTAID